MEKEKYIIGVHLESACENLYFLVNKDVYEFIQGEVFDEKILERLSEVFADEECEIPLIKVKFHKYFKNRDVMNLANAFAYPGISEIFGYKLHNNILSLMNEIHDMKINVLPSSVDIIIDEEEW